MKKGVVISICVLLILLVLACSLIGYGDLLPGIPPEFSRSLAHRSEHASPKRDSSLDTRVFA